MSDLVAFAQHILDSQPFSVLIGARMTDFAPGNAELRVPVTPQLLQQFGFVHGGVLSYAADNALTFAGGSVLGPQIVTAEYKINYVRPARGEELIARAIVLSQGRRQAVCQCTVVAVNGGEETVVAVALGTIMTLGGEQ